MSTRSIVAITDDGKCPLLFYRHSDGDPDGVQPTLDQFCEWLRDEKIRDNPSQAAGWLVLLGHQELVETQQRWSQRDTSSAPQDQEGAEAYARMVPSGEGAHGYGWKSSLYEPCLREQIGWDIEWLHVVNVNNGTWHPIDPTAHPEISEADARSMEASRAHSAAERQGKTERAAAQKELNRADSAYRRACLKAVKSVFDDLQSDKLPSWQPEAEAPAPA